MYSFQPVELPTSASEADELPYFCLPPQITGTNNLLAQRNH